MRTNRGSHPPRATQPLYLYSFSIRSAGSRGAVVRTRAIDRIEPTKSAVLDKVFIARVKSNKRCGVSFQRNQFVIYRENNLIFHFELRKAIATTRAINFACCPANLLASFSGFAFILSSSISICKYKSVR